MPVIDLTRPLSAATEPYRQEGYSDPPIAITPWCGIAERGFAVSALALGTQSGTHIDAPAHFAEGGPTLEALAPEALLGPYTRIDLRRGQALPVLPARAEPILLLDARGGARLSAAMLEALIRLEAPLWVMAGEITVPGEAPLRFHERIAQAGIYLVEDLAEPELADFPPRGEIIALPLALQGTTGSPCRVLLRY
ncbi:Kynurenine formamidase [Pseudoruegeria aquimaris]|uniref:Kynurenine formamidase n=1 Tax=Pseudoruegeria aquimaris TaxID=393663 RepID=A0A1Y5SPK2_9RHOB|nr:cyclase family protein [Pseudoruegeria aquimaris]SLN42426.1 Kynurenine formamidase [Pseudoruegeria aquimaris]